MSRLADDDDVTVRFLAREESSLDGTGPRTDPSPRVTRRDATLRRERAEKDRSPAIGENRDRKAATDARFSSLVDPIYLM